MTTIPVKTKFLLLGLAAGGVSSDFGVVPIFFSLAHAQAGTFAIKVVSDIYIPKIKEWICALQPIKYGPGQLLCEI